MEKDKLIKSEIDFEKYFLNSLRVFVRSPTRVYWFVGDFEQVNAGLVDEL